MAHEVSRAYAFYDVQAAGEHDAMMETRLRHREGVSGVYTLGAIVGQPACVEMSADVEVLVKPGQLYP